MADIHYIMNLLDWNRSEKEQENGIKLSKDIQNIAVFLQPCNEAYHKNVWDNCAKILSERDDDELAPYLIELMEWLQDMNWPGAFCILDRLQRFADKSLFCHAYSVCLKHAKAMKDDVWESNLKMIEKES